MDSRAATRPRGSRAQWSQETHITAQPHFCVQPATLWLSHAEYDDTNHANQPTARDTDLYLSRSTSQGPHKPLGSRMQVRGTLWRQQTAVERSLSLSPSKSPPSCHQNTSRQPRRRSVGSRSTVERAGTRSGSRPPVLPCPLPPSPPQSLPTAAPLGAPLLLARPGRV